jgi:hypothetical protein
MGHSTSTRRGDSHPGTAPRGAAGEPASIPGGVERRRSVDRRLLDECEATNLERRRGPGRRLSDFLRAAEEGELDREQFLFLVAIEEFKRVNGKAFPAWTDVLEVIRKLGYRKTLPSSVNLRGRAEDFTERPDAPAGVTRTATAA